MENLSPKIQVSTVLTKNNRSHLHVVREDLLPGGTKQRAILPLLKELAFDGFEEFVYSSPFCGFAQVALAFGAQQLGLKARIFAETLPNNEYHDLSILAENMGASLAPCQSLMDAEEKANTYAESKKYVCKLPLGFNHPVFLLHYENAIREQFDVLCGILGCSPSVVWLPVGSGTLARLFRKVLPSKVKLICVDVKVLPAKDPRIQEIESFENTQLLRSELKFHDKNLNPPPLPSNPYYDAKLWTFLDQYAEEGDVWWNVAR